MNSKTHLLGIDVGSVGVGLALIDSSRRLLRTSYRFHHGDIQGTLAAMLTETDAETEAESTDNASFATAEYIAATASCPQTLPCTQRFENQLSAIRAATVFHPGLRGLLIVGGEKFSFARFDSQGNYLGSTTNTSCAAGTGSFLDQQAGRLSLSGISELATIASESRTDPPQIASRCAVFAKTDLIHAQQEGYQLDEISNGLCLGLAKNIADTLFKRSEIEAGGEIIFCGGVAKNRAVVNHLQQISNIRLTTPANGHLYCAVGAAMLLLEELEKQENQAHGQPARTEKIARTSIDKIVTVLSTSPLQSAGAGQKRYHYPPLTLRLSSYPDFSSLKKYTTKLERLGKRAVPVEVDLYLPLQDKKPCQLNLGIDIGSTSTKAVLLNETQEVVAGFYTRTAGRPLAAVQSIFFAIDELATHKNASIRIKGCSTTGSGRKFIGKLVGADTIVDEITAHARAAYQLNPAVDTIIEIGGQDAKFTTMRDGRVTSSTMNNVCAAGTGSFIEEQAVRLDCPISDYSRRTEGVAAPMTSDRCTVFMERDINHFLSEGYSVNEVLAAALHSVRENYMQKVATESNIGETIFFQGATARNRALVAAFEQRLNRPILVSPYCHLTGALGAALIQSEEKQPAVENATRGAHFVGLDIYRQDIPIRSEICSMCTNHCKISIADVAGQQVAYGFLCGRDYDTEHYVRKKAGGYDLLANRRRLSRTQHSTSSDTTTERPSAKQRGTEHTNKLPLIGLPSGVHLVDDLHLWKHFFSQLGIPTLSSEKYHKAIKKGKELTQAEFCAPVAALHGHCDWLLKRCDYVFLPVYLENKSTRRNNRRQFCYYTQFLPALIEEGCADSAGSAALHNPHVATQAQDRILRPVLRYLYTSFHTKVQLYRMLQRVAPNTFNFFSVSSAYDQALAFDKQFRADLQAEYNRQTATRDDMHIVFVGRPYSLLSPGLNCNIPTIFNQLGVDTFYQDMFSYTDEEVERIRPLLDELHWEHAATILAASEAIARRPNSYPVFVTSFKCSPDSFAVDYFKKIMEYHRKPYLILELDEHGSSVGYETRIEAAVRAFRNHHGQATAKITEHQPQHVRPDEHSEYEQSEQRAAPLAGFPDINPQFCTSLTGKKVFMPNWDNLTCALLTATLRREGYEAYLLEETDQTIRESLRHNSGQCIPLNAVAQSYIEAIRAGNFAPEDCVLWVNRSTLACNIRLYPHHITQILHSQGLGKAGVYQGDLSFGDISLRACKNAYFAYMIGGMLRKVACRIRPYETEPGTTDRVLARGLQMLCDSFEGKRSREKTLDDVIRRFEWIDTRMTPRPKVAIFGDLYSRDNEVMNQDLVRFIEQHGGEVITTPYSEYAKMIAGSYFRKWFNEGKYLDVLANSAMLAAMNAMEKSYTRMFNRILGEQDHRYDDNPAEILARYNIAAENSGESMDNILKIHYLSRHYPDLALLVQASPSLCCASLITEAMKSRIEAETGIPVVSVTYDGTGGSKNDVIIPYLRFGGDRMNRHPGETVHQAMHQ